MRDSKVRTSRPLSLTSDVVVRPTGPLDAECADELRDAIEYVIGRPGGLIVVDCSDVSVVSADGTSVLEWLEQDHHGDRVVELRHLATHEERGLDRPAVGPDLGGTAGAPS